MSITSFSLYIAVLYLTISTGCVYSQLCPTNSHTFTTGSCLSISSSLSTFTQATTNCTTTNGGNLVTVTTSGQLYALRGYARSLGSSDNKYWIGYQYNESQLLSVVDDSPAPSFLTNEILSNGITPSSDVCIAIMRNGSLVNEQCSDMVNGYFCHFRRTFPSVSAVRLNDTVIQPSSPQTLSLGLFLNLSCDFTNVTSSSNIQWTLDGTVLANTNGITISMSSDRSSTILSLTRFLQAGVYRCMVTNSDGTSAGQGIQLYGSLEDILFVPGPLSPSGFIGSPNTNTSLLIQWFPPQLSYVPSPLLLQYTLYYTANKRLTNINDYQTVPYLTTDPSTGIGSYVLNNLAPGTTYYLRMRASNEAGDGEILQSLIQATTYGIAPRTAPSNLKLSRNQANSALLADWDDVMTTPPVGEVAFNQIEFRSRGSVAAVNILFVDNRFSFASIFNVSNAVSYEVRVRSAVQSTRDPVTYVYGPYSDWVSVTGIATAIPSVPTIQPITDGSLDDNTLTIALSVALPIVVVVVVIVVAIACVVLIVKISNSRKEFTDGQERPARKTNKVSSEISLPQVEGENEQLT